MKKPRRITYVLLASYITLLSVLVMTVLMLPTWFQKVELSYITETESRIHQVVKETEEQKLMQAIKDLREQYPMEIAIYKNDKTIYNTLPGVKFKDLREILQSQAIVYEAQGTVDGKTQKYDVWYSIYRPSIQIYFNNVITIQFVIIIIASALIITISVMLHRILLKPLTQVKDSLAKLEAYDLDNIKLDADDVITESMQRFAGSLNNKIRAVSRNHTELEHNLQLERERLQNMITVSRGIIHDLKSPLHQTLLENDYFMRTLTTPDEKVTEITEYNIHQMDDTLKQINEVLNFLDTNVQEMTEVKDNFDIIKMFKTTRKSFYRFIEEKQLYLDASMPEVLFVTVNKVTARLILHNLFSNAIQYATNQTDINFAIYIEDNNLIITCENSATPKNLERIRQSESLFTAIPDTDTDDETYVYSTGNGLYLIKELALLVKGTYTINIEEPLVTITVTMPLANGGV